jgi:hypothetical protein
MGNPPASLLMVTILSITVRIDNVVDRRRFGASRENDARRADAPA